LRIFGTSLPYIRRQNRFELIHTVHFAKIPNRVVAAAATKSIV